MYVIATCYFIRSNSNKNKTKLHKHKEGGQREAVWCSLRVEIRGEKRNRRVIKDKRQIAACQWATIRALVTNQKGWKENVKALCALREILDMGWSY